MSEPRPGRRSALVTGGASGIGRALAEALGRRGVAVTIADRQLDLAAQVAEGIRASGGAATAVELDVRDAARFRTVVEELVAREGRLDYLFNNAGIGVSAEIKDYELEDWDDVLDVNLRGVAYGIQAAYPVMVRQGFGHVVNTASMAGFLPVPFAGSYAASKHAVVGLSRTLRIEAETHGVRVSALCPGFIRTPILEGGRYGRLKYRVDPARLQRELERARPMDPSLLAERVLHALDRNRAIIVEPRRWRVLWLLDRLFPAFGHAFGRMLLRRSRRLVAQMQRTGGGTGGGAAP